MLAAVVLEIEEAGLGWLHQDTLALVRAAQSAIKMAWRGA